jgi:hypothetical protein
MYPCHSANETRLSARRPGTGIPLTVDEAMRMPPSPSEETISYVARRVPTEIIA